MSKTLYICYFGVSEPLVQTQVLPYLREIRKGGTEVSLLTFEPNREIDTAGIRGRLAAEGIQWHSLPYHKRLSVIATAWDIFKGTLFVRRFISKERPDILHGRVHVPTLMGALGRKVSRHKPKLLFDIRGFFPEEYTDAGVWPEGGLLYRSAKRVERWLLKEADGFIVLTEKARSILFPESAETGFEKFGRPVEVIPCCVDIQRFSSAGSGARGEVRNELNLDGRFVVAYVGAFGGWYLTKETADFFGALKAKNPKAFALILTQSPAEMIAQPLRDRGYGPDDFLVTKVRPDEISRYLSAADAAVSLIKPSYSKQASSPTKNAEYLASGLPMVANAGVGDVDSLVNDHRVGAIVSDLSDEGYSDALDQLAGLGDISDHCREVAREEFDLEQVGGPRYRRIYGRLLND
jgi:glycosyltransferase involved in cell wall biosynthesis